MLLKKPLGVVTSEEMSLAVCVSSCRSCWDEFREYWCNTAYCSGGSRAEDLRQ